MGDPGDKLHVSMIVHGATPGHGKPENMVDDGKPEGRREIWQRYLCRMRGGLRRGVVDVADECGRLAKQVLSFLSLSLM